MVSLIGFLTTCQSHRVISGQSNSVISRCTLKISSHIIYIHPFSSQSTKPVLLFYTDESSWGGGGVGDEGKKMKKREREGGREGKRERDRDRARQTDRDRDRQRQTETERDRDRQTETERERQRQTDRDRTRTRKL